MNETPTRQHILQALQDGAADVLPLAGLSKRRVRALGFARGAPLDLVNRLPTADLETLRPLHPDEQAFAMAYQTIDDFLGGLPVDAKSEQIIVRTCLASMHKRTSAARPDDIVATALPRGDERPSQGL